jgi:hypothetical protein
MARRLPILHITTNEADGAGMGESHNHALKLSLLI